MLEVLNAGSTELSVRGGDHEILLNCWNKSSPLIKELERTVNFAERKCGDLMQELHFYKEYYEKWAQFERVNHTCHKRKIKKCCRENPDFGSSSENELEKANQYLYKKIRSKICEMNNEISRSNRKIHSKIHNVASGVKNDVKSQTNLQPKDGCQDGTGPPSSLTIENKTCKSEPAMMSYDVIEDDTGRLKVRGNQSCKSVPIRKKISKYMKKEFGSSEKRCGNLQRFQIRSKSLPHGVRRKFGFGGFFEVFEPDGVKSRSRSRTSLKTSNSKSFRSCKSRIRLLESRKVTPKSSKHGISKSKSDVKQSFGIAKTEVDAASKNRSGSRKETAKEANECMAIVPSGDAPRAEPELGASNSLRNLIAKPNALLPFLQHPIPFIPCSSTTRSFNLGLNVQQVLSLIKGRRHSVTLQAIVRNGMQAARSVTEPAVNTLYISQTATGHGQAMSAICPAREASEYSFSTLTDDRFKCSILKQVQTLRSQELSREESAIEITKPERPEDVWAVEQPDPTSREVGNTLSKCTCFPSKHCVDYNKVLRQYTSWRFSPELSRSEGTSSYLCAKSKLCFIPCGDDFGRGESDGRADLLKVHNDLLNLTRRCSTLQKQISKNCLNDFETNAELDAMESELAVREIEFKNILNFYNQLITLKEKLKSLRTRAERSHTADPQQRCQRRKRSPLRPTPSMALAKVLRKIQGLQDKIKLVDAP